jgi:hypothetical protein
MFINKYIYIKIRYIGCILNENVITDIKQYLCFTFGTMFFDRYLNSSHLPNHWNVAYFEV